MPPYPEEVYRDEVNLETDTTLPAGYRQTYQFEIPSPGRQHVQEEQGGGLMGGMTFQIGGITIGADRRARIKWRVEGRLDTPGLDLVASRKVQINLG